MVNINIMIYLDLMNEYIEVIVLNRGYRKPTSIRMDITIGVEGISKKEKQKVQYNPKVSLQLLIGT